MDGQSGRCVDDLTNDLRLSPSSGATWSQLFDCLQVAGRWDEATVLAGDAANRPPEAGQQGEAERAYLRAAKSRSPEDIAKARILLLPKPGDGAGALFLRIKALSMRGLVDDAFAAADRWSLSGEIAETGTDFLFFPQTASMRRDPRFMKLAARLGLVDYWRSSGHWPDFCGEPTLPYDCRTEAARAMVAASAKP